MAAPVSEISEIVRYAPSPVVPRPASWDGRAHDLREAQAIATGMAAAGLEDAKSAAVAFVKILAGIELGIGPFTAIKNVDVIEGKAVPNAHLKAGQIKRHHGYIVHEYGPTCCHIEFLRNVNGQLRPVEGQSKIRVTLEEAKKFGWHLSRKGNEMPAWQKTPAAMLFARVITMGYNVHYPDLSCGTPEYERDEPETIPVTVTGTATNGTPVEGEVTQAAFDTNPEVQQQAPELFARYAKIEALVQEAGVTPEQWANRLARDGARSTGDLNEEQLARLEDQLTKLAQSKRTA